MVLASYVRRMALFNFDQYFGEMGLMPPIAEFLACARDVATGLQTIHSKGLTHGSNSSTSLLLIRRPGSTSSSEADLDMRSVIGPIGKGFSSRPTHMNLFRVPSAADRPACSEPEGIWALGRTWLWCLTGRKVPAGTDAGVNVEDAIKGLWKVFRVSGKLGQRLARLLTRMTAPNPMDRPTVEGVLADAIWCHVVEPSVEPLDETCIHKPRCYTKATWAGESIISTQAAST